MELLVRGDRIDLIGQAVVVMEGEMWISIGAPPNGRD
jgi:hypothetical protein